MDWKDKVVCFDCEVFKYDWLFVFKSLANNEYYCFHNDYQGLTDFINKYDMILCGYNNKYYDNYILKGILSGLPISEIKEINDMIIQDGVQGWEIPNLNYVRIPANTDLMLDVPMGLSLKEIEGNLGMNIKESSVDFNLDRPLTKEEFDEVLVYCKHDVDATAKLFDIRIDYLNSKIMVGEYANLDYKEVIGLTNAKLTAMFLGAKLQYRTDANDYVIPDNVDLTKIPKEVLDFFSQLKNMSGEESENNSKLKLDICNVPHTVGWGGLHGAIPNYKEG